MTRRPSYWPHGGAGAGCEGSHRIPGEGGQRARSALQVGSEVRCGSRDGDRPDDAGESRQENEAFLHHDRVDGVRGFVRSTQLWRDFPQRREVGRRRIAGMEKTTKFPDLVLGKRIHHALIVRDDPVGHQGEKADQQTHARRHVVVVVDLPEKPPGDRADAENIHGKRLVDRFDPFQDLGTGKLQILESELLPGGLLTHGAGVQEIPSAGKPSRREGTARARRIA